MACNSKHKSHHRIHNEINNGFHSDVFQTQYVAAMAVFYSFLSHEHRICFEESINTFILAKFSSRINYSSCTITKTIYAVYVCDAAILLYSLFLSPLLGELPRIPGLVVLCQTPGEQSQQILALPTRGASVPLCRHTWCVLPPLPNHQSLPPQHLNIQVKKKYSDYNSPISR